MRYVLRQKFWSWGDDFRIQDAEGADVFFVDGRAFSWGDKLSFRNMQGEELAFIRQKMLSWGPTYEITRDGNVVATVKKKVFTLLRHRCFVDVPGPNDLEAKGNFLDHEYQFTMQDRPVAEVSKKWIALRDSYTINISEGVDEVLILACAVVIDLACHEPKNR